MQFRAVPFFFAFVVMMEENGSCLEEGERDYSASECKERMCHLRMTKRKLATVFSPLYRALPTFCTSIVRNFSMLVHPKDIPDKTIRKDEKGTREQWAEVANLLSFCSAYEFPAIYVYGFRDRLASREIGLSTYSNSSPASPFRQTRTRVQDRSFNYASHWIREIHKRILRRE